MPQSKVVWTPSNHYFEKSRLLEFCRASKVPYEELDEWAEKEPQTFWREVDNFLDLQWQKPYRSVIQKGDVSAEDKWFVGGEIDLAHNCVTKWSDSGFGDRPAITWEIEDGTRGVLSYKELDLLINKFCNVLTGLGAKVGDRIAIQMPMTWESVVVQLGAARIGAILVPIFSGYASEAVVERLRLSSARFFVVTQEFERRGKAVRLDSIRVAACALGSIESVILVGEGPLIDGEVSWHEELESASSSFKSSGFPSSQPLMIAYTSGTTGRPKGISLSQIGFAIKAASDCFICFDFSPDDVVTWMTDPGWVMSPITIYGAFLNGATLALYSGAIDFPDTSRLWKFVDDHSVTFLGVSPTLTRSLMSQAAPPRSSTGSLRVLGSSGEPWTPDAFEWLFHNAGLGELPIINYSGGTELSGGILSNRTIEPIVPCGFFGPIPGMNAAVLDDDGAYVEGVVGELALRHTSPGMPLEFWGEAGRYFETYWSRWKDIWAHGDFAQKYESHWFIRGRSDDTIKIAGKRVGPAEIESIVNLHTGIAESAAIGLPDPIKGEALVVVVKRSASLRVSEFETVADEVKKMVADQLGKPLMPKYVYLVSDLPKNRSGKILRRLIKAASLGADLGDTSSLENPESLSELRILA